MTRTVVSEWSPYQSLDFGTVALALVAAIDVGATIAMTVTTPLGVPWSNVLFQLLAALLMASVVYALGRDLSASRITFAAGLLCGFVPSLIIASRYEISHWDDFMTWLGNALYIWKFGTYPTINSPPIASLWPGYPPGSSLILAAIWSVSGHVSENAGPVISVIYLMILPGLVLHALGRKPGSGLIASLLTGCALGIAASVLNVALDWHWVLSSLPETATLVSFTAAFVLAAEFWLRKTDALPRSHLAALAGILAFIVNLKQTGVVLVALLVLALVLAGWTWREFVRPYRLALVGGLVLAPAVAVWLCWQIYRHAIFPANAFAMRALRDWHFAALPDLVSAILNSTAHHWLFFLPICLVVLRGWYVLGRAWLGRSREHATWNTTWGDRLAALFALVECAYLIFLFVCYLGAFNEQEARIAAEFFRYQTQIGGAGLITAIVLLTEYLPRPMPAPTIAAALAFELAVAALILPTPGIYMEAEAYALPERQQLRQIGRAAGRAITKGGQPAEVQFLIDDDLLAITMVQYDMWASDPRRVRSIDKRWVEHGELPARFAQALRLSPHVVAIEGSDRRHCAVHGQSSVLELISPESDAECLRLLHASQRAAASVGGD